VQCSFVLCAQGKQAAYTVRRYIYRLLHPKWNVFQMQIEWEAKQDRAMTFWLDYCGWYGYPNV